LNSAAPGGIEVAVRDTHALSEIEESLERGSLDSP
jgi:hypothetical protein